MLYRGIYIANLNNETLLCEEAHKIVDKGFDTLARISSPGKRFDSIGDNGGPEINPILKLGIKMTDNIACKAVLKARTGNDFGEDFENIPLDYCDTITGFATGRSSWSDNANYFIMSIKEDCGDSGHNHMDMLSMCLWVRGESIFGEPYVNMLYHKFKMNSDERGFMYNMTSHNTVLAYSNPVRPNSDYANKWGVFRPDTHIKECKSSKDAMFISGYHDAYTFCRHSRQVLFVREKGWVVRDSIIRGNRQESPHIQRWFLEKGAELQVLGDNAILLKKNHAKLLCVWRSSEEFKLTIWKKDDLFPEIFPNKEDINYTIDVIFKADSKKDSENATVRQDVIMLDVSDRNELPSIEAVNEALAGLEKAELSGEEVINLLLSL